MGMQISEGSLRGEWGWVKVGWAFLDFLDVLLTWKQGGVQNDLKDVCLVVCEHVQL